MKFDVKRRRVGKLPPPLRIRKHGTEWLYMCPKSACQGKSEATLELNVKTGVFHCFRCGWSGKIEDLGKVVPTVDIPVTPDHLPAVKRVPQSVYRVISHRGMSPEYVIDRYQIGWDGGRLCWRVADGVWWRRAIYHWQEPKVLFDAGAEKGILGEHLLTKRCYLVITEGDYKAASIPLPFTGVAIGGTTATNNQLDILAYYRPELAIVALDGGVDARPIVRKLRAKDINTVSVALPPGLGPDDIPMQERVAVLTTAYKQAKKLKRR